MPYIGKRVIAEVTAPDLLAALRIQEKRGNLFCRPGELLTMRWEDVDLEAGEWRYTASKTNTNHLVPLSRQAVALLEEIHPLTGHLPGGWVSSTADHHCAP